MLKEGIGRMEKFIYIGDISKGDWAVWVSTVLGT
jgi:hypothetical protein